MNTTLDRKKLRGIGSWANCQVLRGTSREQVSMPVLILGLGNPLATLRYSGDGVAVNG